MPVIQQLFRDSDFDAAGVAQTDEQIHRKMAELLSEAIAQIENG